MINNVLEIKTFWKTKRINTVCEDTNLRMTMKEVILAFTYAKERVFKLSNQTLQMGTSKNYDFQIPDSAGQ